MRFVFLCCFCAMSGYLQGQAIQLLHSTRTTGIINEVDPITGVTLATNIGGITNARGMAFSPLGGLFVAHGNQVSFIATLASIAMPIVSYAFETPHDVNFDAAGNLYVVTSSNVYVYNSSNVQQLVFPHGLTTTTGDGNGEKGWGIAVRPSNGEIYVVGSQGMRRFNPSTGAQVGGTISGSSFGFAGIAFTGSGFSNAYIYVGNVISGVDQVRVFDTGLNLLRTFFPPHIGNPIDLEVNSLNGDLYLFNTVVTNPANRFLANETLAAGFSVVARPTRGSALGSFSTILNRPLEIHLRIDQRQYAQYLTWEIQGESIPDYFEISRSKNDLVFELLGKVEGDQAFEFLDQKPASGQSTYKIVALNADGQALGSTVVYVEGEESALQFSNNQALFTLTLESQNATVVRLEGSVMSLDGREVFQASAMHSDLKISYLNLAAGIYLFEGKGFAQNGDLLAKIQQKLIIQK